MDYSILLGFHFRDKDACPNTLLEQHQIELRAKDKGSRRGSKRPDGNNSSNYGSSRQSPSSDRDYLKEKEKEAPSFDSTSDPIPRAGEEDIEAGAGDGALIFGNRKCNLLYFVINY